MEFKETSIAGLFVADSKKIGDERGFFRRLYCQNEQTDKAQTPWQPVQINHSYTKDAATLRGLHYQAAPALEAKMVRCLKGSVMDIIVDLRSGSETFLKHEKIELSATNGFAALIPEGCAHGFQTLEDDCELLYLHSAFYEKEHEGGVLYNDPMLAIDWPLKVGVVSDRDQSFTPLSPDFKGLLV